MRPSEAVRSQGHWLLEHFPEASINDEGIESLVLEEIASSQAESQPAPAAQSSLFSIGEAADLRDATVKGHPVLAVASGVGGNVLRLISLSRQDWLWNEPDIMVRVHAPNARLEGEWCQDAVPITLVKFAVDPKKYDPIRWLLVQNGASTTVYEPELRAIPMPATDMTTRASRRPVVNQIFANPLFTIPCERTGGSPQSDVCFSRNPDMDSPSLVIVDECGYWSLWDVTGRRSARPKVLTPVMKMCGNTISGSIPKLPLSCVAEPQPHSVLFLSLGQEQSQHTGNPSEHSSESGEEDRPQPPRRLLLLCNPRALHLFDLTSKRLHSASHMVLPKDTHRILGMAPSRLDPCQAFVLTSTNLLWVAARESRNGVVTLDILVSCLHHKDVNDPTLRLDVSPGAYINDHKACFVCVRSTRDTEMSTFWFINPDPGTPVRYHRDVISLRSPSNFVGLSVLPAARRIGNGAASAAGRAMRKAKLRFFQLLILGQDLDVYGALCAWSDEPNVSVPLPDARIDLQDGTNRRIKLLQTLTDAFAVPDEFDERVVFGRKGLESPSLEGFKGGIQPRIDFTLAAQRLSAEEEMPVKDTDGYSRVDGDDFSFIGKAIEQETHDDYMPRRSLYVLPYERRGLQAANNLLDLTWQRLTAKEKASSAWLVNGMPGRNRCSGVLASGSLFPRLAAPSRISALTT